MTIASEISRLQTAKADIKSSIEAKGVTVPSSAKLDGFDDYIDQIQGTPDYSDVQEYITNMGGTGTFIGYERFQNHGKNSSGSTVYFPGTTTYDGWQICGIGFIWGRLASYTGCGFSVVGYKNGIFRRFRWSGGPIKHNGSITWGQANGLLVAKLASDECYILDFENNNNRYQYGSLPSGYSDYGGGSNSGTSDRSTSIVIDGVTKNLKCRWRCQVGLDFFFTVE